MGYPNVKPSDRVSLQAVIDPVSQGVGTVTSGWVSMITFENVLAELKVGTIGASGTVDAKLQQAQDNGGTGAKDVAGKAITQITASDQRALLNMRAEELDVNNGYCFVRLSVSVGTAASEIAASLYGLDPRYGVAAAMANVQVVA
jgi:hypothetical protein